MKKKFVCTVCGYIHEGEEAPAQCPQCKAPASKFKELVDTELTFVTEHVIGIAKDVDPEIKKGLQANFEGECTEVVCTLNEFPALGFIFQRHGHQSHKGNAHQCHHKAERHKFSIPCLGKILLCQVAEQQYRQRCLKHKLVQAIDHIFLQKPCFPEKHAQHHHQKDRNRGIQAEYQIFHRCLPLFFHKLQISAVFL